MQSPVNKPVIGFTTGDLNGVGMELFLKTFSDNRLLEICTPVLFSSSKVINFYRKMLPEVNFNFQNIKDFSKINLKQVNVFNCCEDEVPISPGELTEVGGIYAIKSLVAATEALKAKQIQGLVTAPINKKNTQSESFNYTGHTPYFKSFFAANDVLMLMVAENLRVALVSEHVPVNDAAKEVTKERILSKLQLLHQSLIKDFGIDKPKIAVLGLNPHAGDDGLIGKEEESIIRPAIKDAKHSMLVTGPFSADAFFARGQYNRFDAVLAMYHDQGLIPFKSLASGDGVNFTAGLPVVRTSPDHGTAFDIAGKNKAEATSYLKAIYECIDIIGQRAGYAENRRNPLRKMTRSFLANAVDESLED